MPIIGDFHYNGHVLLTKFPDCAAALDKYRINPGNVGHGRRRDEQFATICKVARDHDKPVRIGVNGGSLNQELVMQKMQNTDRDLGKTFEEIINECMVLSALQSTELALECGLRKDQIIISCKVSRPHDLIEIYRDLARKTGPAASWIDGSRDGGEGVGVVGGVDGNFAGGRNWRYGANFADAPAGRRSARGSVRGVCELSVSLGLRTFAPSVTACPGCGRTTSTTFQELAESIQGYIRDSAGVEARV